MNKVPAKNEYFAWAKKHCKVDYRSKKWEKIHKNNVTNVQAAVEHILDPKLKSLLEKCEREYSRHSPEEHQKSDTALLMSQSEINIKWDKKTYSSLLDKVYRFNAVNNLAWDSPPPGGFVEPENWFLRINDMVRTRIVCKYIDGPKILAEELARLATSLGLDAEYSSRQKDDGYYAYHFYVKIPADILIKGALKKVKVPVEIQFTTQLQDVLSKITHQFYEKYRIQRERDASALSWDFNDDRIRIAYLSHTLHLLEAIIHETRNRNLPQ